MALDPSYILLSYISFLSKPTVTEATLQGTRFQDQLLSQLLRLSPLVQALKQSSDSCGAGVPCSLLSGPFIIWLRCNFVIEKNSEPYALLMLINTSSIQFPTRRKTCG